MDSTLNIEEKEIETKNGSQKVTADVVKITSQDYDNFQEKQLESDIHSDFDKSVTPRDNEDDNDLKIEESETEDFNSEDENTTDLGQNPSKPIEKPCLNNDSSDAERTLKMENPIIIDSSIKTNPSISVENLFTVSENNLKLDIVEGNTIGENSSNAEKASSEEDGLNILYEGEEDKRTEVCLLQDNTKYSEEKNVNEETTSASDLKPENSTADSVSLNESNVNEETTSASDSKTEKSTAECVSPNKSNVNEETTSASDSKTENSTAECVSPNESNVNKRTTTASEFSAENTKADGASLNESNEFNNQILDIISDIDINIKAQEKITQLKEQELKLIQKQNDLTNKIQKQQILAKQLSGQNQLTQNNCQSRELDLQSQYENEHRGPTSTLYQKNTSSKESTNVSKTVDLRKIFTPATDAAEILPNHLQQYHQRPVLSPNILPAYSDAGKHRVQLNIHQNQLIERYSKPGLQVVQSPWKAALQTGSASSAFLEDTKDQCFLPPALSPIPYSQTCCKDSTDAIEPMSYGSPRYHTNAIASSSRSVIVPSNPQRDLAYTPCVAQGWGSRNVELPKGLYVPKEISLSSYAAPPQQCGGHAKHCELSYDDSFSHTLPRTNFSANENSFGNIGIGEFPLSKPLTTGLNIGTPKQEPYSPPSYTKIVPGLEKVKFNQAPLPTENLARYEQPDRRSLTSGSSQYLNALQNSQIRNASPIPFGTSLNEQTSWRPKGLLKGTSLSPLPNQVQTFNKCARGWRSTPVKEQSYSSQYTSPLAGNLPYSDF
ncbi:protein PF14_0175 isoform X19 [Drosophila santomea]|uniref:protein PF14_0175 isoform X19 n=1 Tax=Drosophila santomea TaxID=129105 RepID=UPI0019536268|nr:protein PF14_0175 isoform X19 [Drosophila santomea]